MNNLFQTDVNSFIMDLYIRIKHPQRLSLYRLYIVNSVIELY